MPFAASAMASWVSAAFLSSAFLISSSFCFLAISVWDSTSASFASFAACARATATSRSAFARAIAASFEICAMEVLDVERDDLEAHPREVGVSVGLDHVRELLAVEHHLLRVHLADDLSHVALEHLLGDAGDVVRRGVEEVHRGEVDLLRIAPDLDVHHCVDVNVDEVGVRHGLGRLDVDLDELKRDLVEALEERNPEVRAADDRPALEPGDYVRHVRRGLYVGHDEKQDDEKDRRRDEYCLQI